MENTDRGKEKLLSHLIDVSLERKERTALETSERPNRHAFRQRKTDV